MNTMKFRVSPNLAKEAGITALTGNRKNISDSVLRPIHLMVPAASGISANNALYIKSLMEGQLNFESENLQPRDVLNEYIMTSLRTMEGLDLQYVSDQFGKEKGLFTGKECQEIYPVRKDRTER